MQKTDRTSTITIMTDSEVKNLDGVIVQIEPLKKGYLVEWVTKESFAEAVANAIAMEQSN